MDPSQIQEDKGNDVNSLGKGDEAAKDGIIDATGGDSLKGSGGAAADKSTPVAPPKVSFLKRLWQRFNMYLLLFIFMITIAIGGFVYLTLKSKQSSQTTTKSQTLSPDALKQLASSDVTVGDAKQVLSVQSNAIFAGAVLVRSSQEIAGTLKVGGQVSLTSLQVSGSTQLSDTQVSNLTVNGALNLQGALTIKNGLNVGGSSNFTGSITTPLLTVGALQLNGDLSLTHHVTAGGTIPSIVKGTAVGGGGTVSLSGSDTGGSIAINTGSSPPAGCFANISFSQKYSSTPHVVVTPIGSSAAGLAYYIDRSTAGFSLCTLTPAPAGENFGFDYIVLG